jgi:hypothetical protein
VGCTDRQRSDLPAGDPDQSGSSGLFFNWDTSTARRSDAVRRFSLFQFVTTFRNRIDIYACDESQLFVATMSKLLRFQTDIQPSLMFIQRAQKKVHLLM